MLEPSEFEGTVKRIDSIDSVECHENVTIVKLKHEFVIISSNVLTSSSILMDQLKEEYERWSRLNLSQLCISLDEKALQYSSLKEDYVERRKSLASKVRMFTTAFLESTSQVENDYETTSSTNNWKVSCQNLIASFKKEFDHLASLSRFTESAFLHTYKSLTEVNDPISIFQNSMEFVIGFKEFHAEVKKLIDDIEIPQIPKVPQVEESAPLPCQAVHIDQYNEDTVAIKSRMESEMRDKEERLRNYFEQQQLDMQMSYESSIAQKDSEIASLFSSLNESYQRSIDSKQQEDMLTKEIEKRRNVEEKLRATLTELSESQSLTNSLQINLDTLQLQVQSLESQLNKKETVSQATIDELQKEINNSKRSIIVLENQLANRPPVDFTALASSLGMNIDSYTANEERKVDNVNVLLDAQSTSLLSDSENTTTTTTTSWLAIEKTIIDQIRKLNTEASSCRVKYEAVASEALVIKTELIDLKRSLIDRDSTIATLEKELLNAHNSWETESAILQCVNSSGLPHYNDNKDKKAVTKKFVSTSVVVNDSSTLDNKDSSDILSIVDATTTSQHQQKHSRIKSVRFKSKQVSDNNNYEEEDNNTDNVVDIDLEAGAGGKGTALAVLGSSINNNNSSSNDMLRAVQRQRDRHMRLLKEREEEIKQLRERFDTEKEEHILLQKENMELYKRLRLLRTNIQTTHPRVTGNTDDNSEDSKRFTTTSSSSFSKTRARKGNARKDKDDRQYESSYCMMDGETVFGGGGGAGGDYDNIDLKYQVAYENQLDPFRLEELDRKVVLSRLNILERSVVIVSRYMLQDQWARHALMVYLFLVHIFACCYVYQVLNPELIEQVDHMNNPWSLTLFDQAIRAIEEHPDIAN